MESLVFVAEGAHALGPQLVRRQVDLGQVFALREAARDLAQADGRLLELPEMVLREVEGRERTKGDEAAAGGFFSSEREPSAAGPFVSSRVGVGVVPQAVRGEGYSAQRGEP